MTNLPPAVEKDFNRRFVRDDGLMNKYGFDDNAEENSTANLIKQFIAQKIEEAYQKGLDEHDRDYQLAYDLDEEVKRAVREREAAIVAEIEKIRLRKYKSENPYISSNQWRDVLKGKAWEEGADWVALSHMIFFEAAIAIVQKDKK